MSRHRRTAAQHFSATVDALYEAATDASTWPVFLERFGTATGSSVVTLHLHDTRDHRIAPFGGTIGCDEAMQQDYISYYASRNVYMNSSLALMQTGFVGLGSSVIPLDVVKRSEYFDGWLQRLGVLDAMSVCIFREDSVLAKLDFLRPMQARQYDREQVEFTRRLVPHLQRAVSVHRRLHTADLQRAGAEQALDGLAFGVCLLDERGRLTFANETARLILEKNDGLSLNAEGRLVAGRPGDRARLDRMIADACATGARAGLGAGGGLAVSRPSGKRHLAAIVTPLRLKTTHLLPRIPVAAVFLSDTEREITAEHLLREIYGLTPAEASVAKLLGEGLCAAELSDRLGVSTATIRTHIRRVLEKLDVNRQAELVRILLAGAASVRVRGADDTGDAQPS